MVFPVKDIDNVVPALLHIHLGVVLLFFEMMEKDCQQLDENDLTDEQLKEIEELKQNISDLADVISQLKDTLAKKASEYIDYRNVLERISKLAEGKKALDELAKRLSNNKKIEKGFQKCAANLCVVSKYDVNVSWVECTKNRSKHWLHTICEGLSDKESLEVANKPYTCLKCSNKNSENHILKKIDEIQVEIDTMQNTIRLQQEHHDKLQGEAISEMGEREKQLNTALADMGVARQAYHSNSFIGNHCKKILDNYEQLCRCLTGTENHEKFLKIFSIFSEPRNLLFRKGFLTDAEIDFVELKCHEFGEYFSVNFDRNIIPKMHEYVFNVPRFVRKHRTIGLLSE